MHPDHLHRVAVERGEALGGDHLVGGAGRGTAAERVILTGEVHCVENLLEDPEVDPAVKDMIRNAGTDSAIGGARSTLAVPMTRDATAARDGEAMIVVVGDDEEAERVAYPRLR